MTRPPSEAADLTHLNSHLEKHLLHVGQPKLAGVVLLERVQLARGDRVDSTPGGALCTGNLLRSSLLACATYGTC